MDGDQLLSVRYMKRHKRLRTCVNYVEKKKQIKIRLKESV